MALSDDPKYKNVNSKKKRPVTAKGMHWSDSQKIEAVTTYLAIGELRLTANLLKIPEITLKVWKQKDWWKEIENELRHQEDLQLSVRLQKIINKSFDQVEDRLSNGDFIYDQKTGELVRKPVSMKDAHKVAVDLVDKRRVLLDRTPQTQSAEGIEDKLVKLAEKFAQIAQAAKAPIEVTDVIYAETPDADEDGRGQLVGRETLDDGYDSATDGPGTGDTSGEEGTIGSTESSPT